MSAFRFATTSLKENQISILYTAQIINMSHDSCFWTWAETYCVRRESWAYPQNTPNNKLPSFKIQLSGEISALKCYCRGPFQQPIWPWLSDSGWPGRSQETFEGSWDPGCRAQKALRCASVASNLWGMLSFFKAEKIEDSRGLLCLQVITQISKTLRLYFITKVCVYTTKYIYSIIWCNMLRLFKSILCPRGGPSFAFPVQGKQRAAGSPR